MIDVMAAHEGATTGGNPIPAASAGGRYARETVAVSLGGAADQIVSAPLAGGGFVLIWIGQAAVQAQLFDSAGAPRGTAFQVSSGTVPPALHPSVVGLTGGGFAVAWAIDAAAGTGDGSGRAVLAQAFDAAGARIGAETLVNGSAAGDQHNPRIAALESGGYAVAWDDSGGKAVRAQLFGPDGGKAGTEIDIVADAAAAPAVTDLALLADGRLLATYEVASGTHTILKAQMIGADGALSGPAFELDPLRGGESDASIAPVEDGGFLLVWTRAAGDSSGSGVVAARYDSGGSPIGVPFPVNSTTLGEQTNAAVRALPEGGFIVTWTSAAGAAASTGELRAQLLDSAGGKVGAEFRIASGAIPLSGSISPLADGGFAVAYDAGGAAARIFTPTTHSDLELSLSRSILSEASIANIAFATIAPSAGASVGGAYRYAIVSDSSGGAFHLAGDKLYVVDGSKLDFETQPNLSLTVRVTDDSGQSVDRQLSLQLTDVAGSEPRYVAGPQFAFSATAGSQTGSSQAALAGDGFVAVWTGTDGSGLGARAQLFDGSGARVGAEIAVNTAPAGSQSNVKVAALGTGFVVSWTDIPANGDGSESEVEAQIFDSTGAKVGDEFVVNTTTAAAQNGADIDSLAGGGFVVAWADASGTGGDSSLRAVRAQIFSNEGAKSGGEILVNTTTAGEQLNPSVAGLAGGGFVVSWTDQGGSVDTDGTALHAQVFDPTGAKVGGEILVPTLTAGAQGLSSVVALASGNFVIVWHSNDSGDYSVKAQMFDPAGARIGGEFRVETSTAGDQGNVAATALPGGGFAISWQDFGGTTVAGGTAIVAQMFDSAANKLGDEFVVNPVFSGNQSRTSGLTALASGDLVASWTENNKVYGRFFEIGAGLAPAAADSYATDESRSVWGRVAHSGVGPVTEVNGVAASIGERIVLASGAALVLRSDGSFTYDPNGAFGRLVATAPTGFHHMVYATSATDSFTYTVGGVLHEATVTIAGVKSDDDTYHGSGLGWGAGDDSMTGTAGAERLVGGTGDDNYTVNHIGDVVVEQPGEGRDFVSTNLIHYALPDNVDSLNYTGSENATLVGNSLDNWMSGGPRSDLFYGGGGNDTFQMWGFGGDTAIAGPGNDIFNLLAFPYGGGTSVQTIVGGGGDDKLYIQASDPFPTGILLTHGGPALAGWTIANGSFITMGQRIDATGISNIEIVTGRGDTYAKYVIFLHDEFAPAGTTLTITAPGLYDGETLTILGSGNFETDAHLHVTGGNGADDLTGGGVADVLRGGDGNDRLDGGKGDDTLYGEGGDDSLYATATAANGGTKTVVGGSGTDRLYVSFGTGGPGLQSSATVTGDYWYGTSSGWIDDGNGNRVEYSDIEAVTITGSEVADQLAGTGGNDVLDGRGGVDRMAGGAGDDIYHIDTVDDVIVELKTDYNHSGDEIRTALAAYTLQAFVEKLTGTSATGQVLTGNSGYNVITGGIGNDIIDGGGGGDWDHFVGGQGNDVYYVDNASDGTVELASEGIDEVRTALASYTLWVNVEKLTGTAATAQTLRGNTSSNTIVGGAAADRLEGLGGNDTLDGGAGADTMLGGSGNDVFLVDDAGDVVTEIAGEGTLDEIRTGLSVYSLIANVENLTGTSAAGQTLNGNGSANVIRGASGNDTIDGGAGADSLRGGGGNDLYFVDSGDLVVENAAEGTDEVRTGLATYVLAANVENLTATSDTARDFRGNGSNNVVTGGGGSDVIRLQDGGNDSAVGGGGDDQIFYGAALTAADSNDGGAGTDVVILQGNYAVTLGAGSLANVEYLSLQSGSSTRYQNLPVTSHNYNITFVDANVAAGQRFVVNASQLLAGESFTFDGSAESDGSFLVYGGFGADVLTGGAGHDVFHFEGSRWSAADSINGGAGADSVVIRAGAGTHHIQFGETQLTGVESISVSDRFGLGGASLPSYEMVLANGNVAAGATLIVNASTLLDPAQTLSVDGSAVSGGHLRLYGGAGGDTLIGGDGDDLFFAAGGADRMTGGEGRDTFQLRSLSDSPTTGADRILDFESGVDKIDLRFIDADSNTAGDQAFAFIGSNAFSTRAGQLRAVETSPGSNVWIVSGDVDGDNDADFEISVTVADGHVLSGSDFLP